MNKPTKPLRVDEILQKLVWHSEGNIGINQRQAKAQLIELVESVKPARRKMVVDKFNKDRLAEFDAANHAYNVAIETYEQALIKAIEGGQDDQA